MEIYVPSVRNLLNEKNHGNLKNKSKYYLTLTFDHIKKDIKLFSKLGVLMGAIGLISEMCLKSPDILAHFRKVMAFF
jgi:hypothetical protein